MGKIEIRGARTHNLRDVCVSIPQESLTVIAGPSGSGKSSLAFDTLYAEGQRRYLEGVSPRARQFLGLMERPDADSFSGLSPSIALKQLTRSVTSLETAGTATELTDFLRLLYARAGVPCCPEHGHPLRATPIAEMAETVLGWPEETPVLVIAPVARSMSEGFGEFFRKAAAQGYQRFRIDGEVLTADEIRPEELERTAPHSVEIVIDRLKLRAGVRERLSESLELAATLADGRAFVRRYRTEEELRFSTGFSCPDCDFAIDRLEPPLFTPVPGPEGGAPAWRREALHVFLGSPAGANYPTLISWPAEKLARFFEELRLEGTAAAAAEPIIPEVLARLRFLLKADLGYLPLSRTLDTLSRGELQRIRLAGCLASRLSGITYVLDEPSCGLHPAETEKLVEALRELRAQGNTVVAVEHDEAVIRAADWVIDMGPGAGEQGGRVTAEGTPAEILSAPESATGAYLSGRKKVPVPAARRESRGLIRIRGARANCLKGFDAEIPAGCITAITGISGSGKTSLARDVLWEAASRTLNGAAGNGPLPCDAVEGLELFDKALLVDQSPIGRTPRSTPATALGIFQLIREAYAETTLARERGYGPGRFSFNAKGGRCEACEGEGIRRIRMQFLPDIFVPCDVCGGARFNRETLEVRFKGLTVADALALSAAEALEVFRNRPAIARRLKALCDTGLGYLRLGQPSHTLSGGEAQRIKIAAELAREAPGRTLFILDDPTSGLHFSDTAQLLAVLGRLCDAGSTAVLATQDPDVIAAADRVIDLGGRGPEGGRLIGQGTPEEIAQIPESLTGRFLKEKLGR